MRASIIVLAVAFSAGCSHQSTGGGGGGGTGDPGGDPSGGITTPVFAPSALEVTGQVVDFETQQPLTGAMTMATAALVPSPSVSVSAPNFTLEGVPPFSVFFLIAGSPPDHRLTYNAPTTVEGDNLSGVTAYSVADTYLGKLRTAANVQAVSGTGTVLVHAVATDGTAMAGVPASAFQLPGSVKGPLYLDDKLQPVANGTMTSSSGWLVYFDVPASTLSITAGAGYSVQAADTPVAGDSVSLVQAVVAKGTTPPPMNVSFKTSIVPIFIARGCYNCHSGNGDGRRLGGLVLDGAPMKIWSALTQDISPTYKTTRVNLTSPEKSLVLTMPSFETPPDPHPTVVFASSADVDYQKLLVWIKEGAKNN
jgi:hypothetical protein